MNNAVRSFQKFVNAIKLKQLNELISSLFHLFICLLYIIRILSINLSDSLNFGKPLEYPTVYINYMLMWFEIEPVRGRHCRMIIASPC